MALYSMTNMLKDARAGGYALGAFEFWSYDSAYAVVAAAKALHVPVILQVGHFERDYMDGYGNARVLAEMAAGALDHPVALHLDHATDIDEIRRALDAGFTSVMIDASALPFDENVALTMRVMDAAKPYGASVEAELGTLGGCEGQIRGDGDQLTDPAQAARFAELTGVDALAVAIGTAHGFYKRAPVIDVGRLREIAGAVSIPLVLHGGSGTPDGSVAECVRSGVAKVNICTEFIAAFGSGFTESQLAPGFSYNVPNLFGAARARAQSLADAKLRLFLGSARL